MNCEPTVRLRRPDVRNSRISAHLRSPPFIGSEPLSTVRQTRSGAVKVAILGLGFMGSTHAKGLRHIPDAELSAVMDMDPLRLSGDLTGIQGNIGGPGEKMDFSGVRRYATIEDVVADPDAEVVDVCLPTYLHAPAAIAALRTGKHVLVEKPMALDGEAADRMIAEADRAGRLLMVAQVLRFAPAYRALIDFVKCGRLGPIRSAVFCRRCAAPAWGAWMLDSARSGGGVFDLLTHDGDMCLHLFGQPESVSATGFESMKNGIDTMLGQLHYPNIGCVTIIGGWHHAGSYPFSMEFTVVGDEGTFEYSSTCRPATVHWADGRMEPLKLEEFDWYRAEIAYFLECCRTGSAPTLCPPRESAAAVKLMNLMLESRHRKGEAVPCGF